MPEAINTTVLCFLIVIAAAIAALFVHKRQREAFQRREAEMREAVDLLALHVISLEALDDEAVPSSLLSSAFDLSDILHNADHRIATLVAAQIHKARRSGRKPASADASAEADALVADFHALAARRPELATAYAQCIVAGILSFERMFPQCAGAFGLDIAKAVASPVNEAERIVRQARGLRAAWPAGAAPAAA